MAYKNFHFTDLEDMFGLRQSSRKLFDSTQLKVILPSVYLIESLKMRRLVSTRTEKARNEFMVAPVLADIKQRNNDRIQLFSGEEINADRKLKLNGEVDFILVHYPYAAEMRDPIFSVTEAKKGAIEEGLSQCAAQMYGARVFNQIRNNPILNIYGAVTNGMEWQFLYLEDQNIFIDKASYSIERIEELLGVLQFIVDQYP